MQEHRAVERAPGPSPSCELTSSSKPLTGDESSRSSQGRAGKGARFPWRETSPGLVSGGREGNQKTQRVLSGGADPAMSVLLVGRSYLQFAHELRSWAAP